MSNLEREIKYLQDAEKIQLDFLAERGWGYYGCSEEYIGDMISRLYKNPDSREENHSDTIIKNVLRDLLVKEVQEHAKVLEYNVRRCAENVARRAGCQISVPTPEPS